MTHAGYHEENDYLLNYLGCSKLRRGKQNPTACYKNAERKERNLAFRHSDVLCLNRADPFKESFGDRTEINLRAAVFLSEEGWVSLTPLTDFKNVLSFFNHGLYWRIRSKFSLLSRRNCQALSSGGWCARSDQSPAQRMRTWERVIPVPGPRPGRRRWSVHLLLAPCLLKCLHAVYCRASA